GISVLNLTISRSFVGDALRSLVETYFDMGGIQVQVTCVSAEELKDAMVHPDKHRDLIVRVGGYSDYFVNLSPALRQTVLERNIHELGE
ncbi:MAG: formate C-acetyltransferase/glycerol dehydratase family glycyl radical enzyme, partial [Clostridia bacterium]|nr:formate C-acetyltransferase/glycerol dehydratase family glycyl radical enzyme [Clostridia bacterium]